MARTRRAAAPVTPDTDDVFEDLDDAPETEEAPAPRRRKASTAKATPVAPEPKAKVTSGHDSNWLAGHASEVLGRDVDSRMVRMALRSLAADGTLAREVGVDRQRYEFPKGANDPTVKAVIAKLKDGAAPRAPKVETETPAPAKRVRKAAAPAAVEEVAETKPTRRRANSTSRGNAAPAKAAPAAAPRTRRRANADA